MKIICLLSLISLSLISLSTLSLSAQETLSKASNAFNDPGWSFHWNSGRGLGTGEYANLEATDQATEALYTVNGRFPTGLAGVEQLFIGTISGGTSADLMGETGGLPGAGSEEALSQGVGRAAILGYAIPKDGPIEIQEGLLSNTQESVDGLSLGVYVNDESEARFSGNTDPGKGMNLPFQVNLGRLKKGDVIYVAVGPRGNNWSDVFAIQYSIVLSKN